MGDIVFSCFDFLQCGYNLAGFKFRNNKSDAFINSRAATFLNQWNGFFPNPTRHLMYFAVLLIPR